MKRFVSMMMTLILALNMFPSAALAVETDGQTDQPEVVSVENTEETGSIHGDTRWSYLDDGSDPAGDPTKEGYVRTSWTAANFDDSNWKNSQASLGAKRGEIGSVDGYTPEFLLNQYKADGSTNVEAFFFRTKVNVADASAVKQILGTVVYDDSATVYINGVKVAGFDDSEITANLQYGGHNSSTAEGEINITDQELIRSVLKNGDNVVAVEVHQGRAASSDIYFDMPSLEFRSEVYKAPVVQSNVSLSMGADQTQMNFTWHVNTEEAGTLLMAKASELVDGAMPENATSVSAVSTVNNDGQYTNKAVAAGLKAGTTYAYQVVNGEVKSAIKTFTTDDGGAFSFAYVADPQIGASGNADSDTSGWDKTLNIIGSNGIFDGISFLLSAGDQVNTASSEDEYDRYLDHDALGGLPVATVIGNHDSSSDAYNQHFNVANESSKYGASTLAGGDSWFVYNNVLFMVLNTNELSAAEHQAFMEEAIAANPDADWKVVAFHHSIYTVASHYNNDGTDRRETLVPVFDELGIDVVLQGHDHVYCRTYMMDGLNVSENENYTYGNGEDQAPTAVTDPNGILYITANSGSGSKHYGIKQMEFAYSAVQNQEHIPNASRIDVSENSFTITTYRTTDLSVVDTFTINKTDSSDENDPVENTPVATIGASEINADTQWKYLDNGIDPSGDPTAENYDRTSWTEADYDDSAWQRASGQFGAKNGGLNTLSGNYTPTVLLSQYKDGTDTDKEAFFFRTQVTIQDASAVKAITGSLIYDDAAVVYLNGTKLVGFNDDLLTETGGNMQYSGNGDTSDVGHTDAPATGAIEITDPAVLSLLKNGVNTIAVELHQDRSTSSDIYFEMPSLVFCTEEEVPEQSDLSLSVGADQSQMNFTWHCTTDDAGTLLIAEDSAVENGQMPENAVSYQTAPVSNNDSKYTNKAVATGLKPGTTYAYQVVNGEVKSEIKTFTTDDGKAFSFAYVGDPQIGASGNAANDTTGWNNTLSIIGNHDIFSGISFLLSAGDQVNNASSESEYDGYLDHDVLDGLPVATVIGNHDSGSDAYSEHFNVANESDDYGITTAGGDSWFVYNNVLFLVLNTNDTSAAEHKAFMEKAIAANPDADWKVVAFHHSIYTVASHHHNDGTDRRETLTPVFKELDIDVVLQGHDHVYCRTYMMDGLNVSEKENYTYGNGEDQAPTAVTDPNGILYITANSGSGSKHYNIQNMEFAYSAVQNQEHIPNASRIDVSENSFTITTYRTTDLSVVDTFTINKTAQEAPSSKPSSPSAPTAYAVNLADMDNGSVVSSSKSASKGSTVTLTVTPDQGYELADLTVTDKSGKELTLTQKGDGVYTFTMPASKVTVSADFQEIQVPASQLPFTDVAEKDWFYDGVSFVYEKGIMNGLTATTFGPSASTTRGMVVTMLWRMEDQPQAQSGAAFADVKEGAYYAQAIDWAAENGIVNGTSDTTFSPEQDVTRQQLAAILYRYSQYKGYDVTAQGDLTAFGDWEQVSDYAVEAMEWAVGSSLIQGIDDNLVPGGSATRAQLATIFSRFITNFGS